MFSSNASQASSPIYLEDVFSTYLYTGNGSTQTITNGIDLSGQGGMVWIKNRTQASDFLAFDTARGIYNRLLTYSTSAQASQTDTLTAFNSTGFSIGAGGSVSNSPDNFCSWTFREQPKFFDVVTYTGSGSGTQTIPHNLGSVPGCIITKLVSGGDTSGVGGWGVYHRSTGASQVLELNSTAAAATDNWYTTAPTSTNFYVFGNDLHSNRSGGTYIAYLFAHDAGGFGLTGTDNVISCGSYVSNGSRISVTLGWEPQWILIKKATGASNNWTIVDSMRELTANATNASAPLFPNLSDAETASSSTEGPAANATGFSVPYSSSAFNYPSGETYIYIAIRRGPMKVPTVGTTVYNAIARTGTGAAANITGVGFAPDFLLARRRSTSGDDHNIWDRSRGAGRSFYTQGTGGESTNVNTVTAFGTDGVSVSTSQPNATSGDYINHFFRRAAGFFDVVCYTGTGSATTFSHNLGVVPELMIVKGRTGATSWATYTAAVGNTKSLLLNSTAVPGTEPQHWNNTTPTAAVFTVGTNGTVNQSTYNYVAYLFATLAGVSKVGTYTGTGTTKQVDCGFTAGARFILIKRTDSTGDWYVWDTVRGIIAGNDPYLLLNSTDVEATSTDYIDTYNAGFELSSTAPAAINANGGTYIFLAIA